MEGTYVRMIKRCDPTDNLWLCDVCLKTEIQTLSGGELRKMWVDDDEEGLVLCEECINEERTK